MVRIEGLGQVPISETQMGSLAVAVFLVKEGQQDSLPVYVYNPTYDIYDAETAEGVFTRYGDVRQSPRAVILGEAVTGTKGTVRIPIEFSEKFNIKSFGLEIRYSSASLEFMRMEMLKTGSEFSAIQVHEVEEGVLRIGGYGRNEIHQTGPGRIMELIFFKTDFGGEIEVIQSFDDIQDFIIQNEVSTLNDRKGRKR